MAVAALAGRRIDRAGRSPPIFPLAHVPVVRERLRAVFAAEAVAVLVCSAACGADLVALEAALAQAIRCVVVLPFDKARFRDGSVTDRPGEWGALYDDVIGRVEAAGDLVVIEAAGGSADAQYDRANDEIVRRAAAFAAGELLAVIVWDGVRRETGDATDGFRALAQAHGFRVVTVPTA